MANVSSNLAQLTTAGWLTQSLAPHATVGASGSINVALPGTPLMSDPFDGSTIDTTYRWTAPVVAGAGAVIQSNGLLVFSTGTGASSAAALTSIETFQSVGAGFLGFGVAVVLEASIGTNTHRFIGQGTPNGSYTALTPLQDAYGWEIDTTGALNAVTYAGGVRTVWKTMAPPNDGFPHIYAVAVRSDAVLFYLDNFEIPIAGGGYQGASTSKLPFRIHVVNHTTGPAVAPTFVNYGMSILDSSSSYPIVWNGQSISSARSPAVFKPLNAVVVTTETTIWTPAAGRKFRLMGFVLTGGVAAGNILLKDGTGGATILVIPVGAAGANIVSPPMGNGLFSAAANNVLTATGAATQTLSGYVFGTEE